MRRIRAVLASRKQHDAEQMRALQRDWWNQQAELLLPALLPALEEAPLDATAGAARRLLAEWREAPVNEPRLAAPLIFERWRLVLAEDLFAERLGPELWGRLLKKNYVLDHALDGLLLSTPDSPWWRSERRERLRASFTRAVGVLAETFGDDPTAWRWDAQQAVVFQHELGKAAAPLGAWLHRGPFPWGGGVATVGRAASRYDRPGFANRGATVRVVLEMGRPPRAWAVIPGGQSGHPLDAHYDDQIAAWLAGEHDILATAPEDVPGRTLRLSPAPRPAR